MRRFREFEAEGAKWLTVVETDFYPDALLAAVPLYAPVVENFGDLLRDCDSSEALLGEIYKTSGTGRTQLLRVFRKYVSPDTSVEMLKRKTRAADIARDFGGRFRPIEVVRERFESRPKPDEALIAVLNEYRDRGQKGYAISEAFFAWFRTTLGDSYEIHGPERAGQDVNLAAWLEGYPTDRRPVDFVAIPKSRDLPVLVGLIRYDSDRGGAQEDDRTSGYRNVTREVLGYADTTKRFLKLLFVNDGPGLLLGSMWRDYSEIEEADPLRIMVATLKMLEAGRLSLDWLRRR